MYSEEIFIKMTKDHIRRCYRAIVLTDKLIELYRKSTDIDKVFYPEELEEEFCKIIEDYLMEGAE